MRSMKKKRIHQMQTYWVNLWVNRKKEKNIYNGMRKGNKKSNYRCEPFKRINNLKSFILIKSMLMWEKCRTKRLHFNRSTGNWLWKIIILVQSDGFVFTSQFSSFIYFFLTLLIIIITIYKSSIKHDMHPLNAMNVI